MSASFKWCEGTITAALAANTFAGHLCCLPNTTWNGGEIDLLVVARCLRIIDVEVKVSRADLRADIKKDKWWHSLTWEQVRMKAPRVRVEWPRDTWKHYYAMPAEIWRDELLNEIPRVSGVLLVKRRERPQYDLPAIYEVECRRRSKPSRNAKLLTTGEIMQLARLTSLRLWREYAA